MAMQREGDAVADRLVRVGMEWHGGRWLITAVKMATADDGIMQDVILFLPGQKRRDEGTGSFGETAVWDAQLCDDVGGTAP